MNTAAQTPATDGVGEATIATGAVDLLLALGAIGHEARS